MTPEEKAKELFDQYLATTNSRSMAQKFATLNCSAILKHIVPKDDDERYAFELGGNQYYWESVREAITKL